jgi:hypothetical protein
MCEYEASAFKNEPTPLIKAGSLGFNAFKLVKYEQIKCLFRTELIDTE